MYKYAIKKVEKVLDGDTIDVTIDLGFSINTKQRIRLNGIDAPETNSKEEPERRLASDAKNFLQKWLSDNPNLVIETTKDDKYGRMLGDIYPIGGKRSVNEQMIEEGYAWAYDGGVKQKDFNLLLEKRKA